MLNASGSRPQSSNRVPYAPPGVARPPRQQTSGGGGGIGGSKSSSHRSRARDRWSQLFQGPAYLEPGASNRLVLSLRSCVASEVDFSLERLIQVSSIDPELLRFNELPGLFDGLLNLIKDYLDLTTTTSLMMNNSETRQVSRKRASEASLILRNLSLEGKKNLEVFIQSKKFKKLLIQVLEQGEIEGFLGEETTEIRLYLLEILELIGEHIPLVIPGHSIPLSSDEEEENSTTTQKPEPLDSPSVKLFPLLVNLTTSPDRALVLASFRCLTVLSLNEKSDHLFSILTYLNLPPLPKTQPHPIETSLKLLTLGDSELTTVLLDFIYQHTLLPSNSVSFSSRNDLVSILKLICSKFELGARIEQVETLVLESNSEAASFFKSNFGDQFYNNNNNKQGQDQDQNNEEESTTQDGLLSMREVREIIKTSEPERTISWMHKMYETDPDSDITQVSLWTAYKTQFEPLTTTNNDESSSSNVPVMLQAQDVIKLAGQTFPSVVPTIVEDPEGRKFIIKGLKLKEKKNTTTVVPGECGWKGCQNSKGHENVLEFHQHVYNSHLLSSSSSSSSPPTTCLWSNCTYTTSSDDDPSLQLARISLHTRTHLPSLSTTTDNNNQTQSVSSSSELPISKLHHVRYHAQVDEHHEATGPSFLTCLILRNLSRTAKLAKEALQPQSTTSPSSSSDLPSGGGGRISVASGNAAIGRLAEGEQSIFEAFALAEESASGGSFSGGGGSMSRKNGILQQVEKPDWKLAEPIIKALESVQDRILKMALSNVVLGKYLVEVVGTIEGFKKDEMRKNLEEGGEGGEGGEEEQVKMEE
ncbi:hypothetical protein JCM3765_004042 [Sporobolomyces pararoseus]